MNLNLSQNRPENAGQRAFSGSRPAVINRLAEVFLNQPVHFLATQRTEWRHSQSTLHLLDALENRCDEITRRSEAVAYRLHLFGALKAHCDEVPVSMSTQPLHLSDAL